MIIINGTYPSSGVDKKTENSGIIFNAGTITPSGGGGGTPTTLQTLSINYTFTEQDPNDPRNAVQGSYLYQGQTVNYGNATTDVINLSSLAGKTIKQIKLVDVRRHNGWGSGSPINTKISTSNNNYINSFIVFEFNLLYTWFFE